MAYPFVQYDLDGGMIVYNESDDLFDFDALDEFKTGLADAEIISSGPNITVVKIAFHWEYPNQNFVGIGNAVWGFEQRGGEFLLRWRQFVGWHEDDA